MLSLRTRLLLAASALLIAFIALCGLGLETAFRNSALAAQQERLQGLVFALLGAADQDVQGRLTLNDDALPEPRLRQPLSGIEAALLDETGAELWRSPSTTAELPVVIGPEVGKAKLERLGETGRFALSYGLRWITQDQTPRRYTVLVLEGPDAYEDQLAVFRRTLWLWLLATAAALLVALTLVQHWGLIPLNRLAGELRGIESGQQAQIDSIYPSELTALTGALNAMIRNERGQQTRYRNALGDLAHSLKTPLAVLRGLSDAPATDDLRRPLDEQVGRMQQIVDHQLAKAATAGRKTLAQPIAVLPIAQKVQAALAKVYAGKTLIFELALPAPLHARIDSGDLYELLGNLLDNAAKWARTRVRLRAALDSTSLVLEVEDDGPGFPADAERLLGRGVRADSQTPGQGLGLAAVAEMVKVYEGTIELGRSAALSGARVSVTIPA